MTIHLLAGTKARHPGCRLVAFVTEETRSRLPAAAGLTSPLSATKMAAQEQCGDETIVRLPLLAEKGAFPAAC